MLGGISTAEEIVREQWDQYYKPSEEREADDPGVQSQASTTSTAQKRKRYHEDIDNFGLKTGTDSDALTAYLDSPIVGLRLDPINYWSSQLSLGDPLARMALDFLSAPAASTDVERAFSRGGLTVSKRRHALSDQSTRCATVFGSWARVPGMIDESEIVSAMKERNKRTKVTKVPNMYVDNGSDVE
ncbi:hypothetical protein QCA50_018316 [Cerrena zonata]|uniref:HAT C-terminal dimerisation domain-containing protein n=1 Tax=Cerrena zonata TaxID=2478898 RepID=A0AAW0FGS5_9APHY